MDEFTNGALPPVTVGPQPEAFCPYCGWVYDQPESCIPAHARCGHLIATAHWIDCADRRETAAYCDGAGAWRLFTGRDGGLGDRQALESALRSILPKVESATASNASLSCGDAVYCRYYFSRRSAAAIADLAKTCSGAASPIVSPRLRSARCDISGCASARG